MRALHTYFYFNFLHFKVAKVERRPKGHTQSYCELVREVVGKESWLMLL